MRTSLILLVTVWLTTGLYAQTSKSIQLKPIYKQGWKYYYDGRKIRTPDALQIPLEAIDDKEINRRYKNYKRLQKFGVLAYLPSLLYLIANSHDIVGGHYRHSTSGEAQRTYLFLVAGGVVGNLTFNALSHHQMAKAIDIYNLNISNKSTLGLSINRLHDQNFPGLTYRLKF